MAEPAGQPSVGTREVARLWITFALLSGLLEALETAIFRTVPDVQPMAKVSLDVVWAAPLVHLAIGAVGIVLLAIAWRLGLPRRPGQPVFVLVLLGMLGVIAYSGYIAGIASLVLSLGAAVQTGRWYAKTRPWRLQGLTVSMVLIVVTAAALVRFQDRWTAGAALATATDRSQPNVLVLVLDTVRADYLSAYGHPTQSTPGLDRLGREATLFERAYATSSWTLPSHASLLTGLQMFQHGAESVSTILGPSHTQLQTVLRDRGYATGAFVANNVFFVPERGFRTGFDVFDVHHWPSLVARTTYGRVVKKWLRKADIGLDPFRPAPIINRRFEEWLSYVGDRPFFAVLNYMDAHEPYLAGGKRPDYRIWDRRDRRTAEDNRLLADEYARAIRALDADLSAFVERSARQSWWDRTLVVVVSDHGEEVANGTFDHGTDLLLDQIHVPLMFRLPGKVPAGVRVRTPVSLVDVPATIQDLIGDPAAPKLPGQSLAKWFAAGPSAEQPAGEGVLSELVEMQSLHKTQSIVLNDHHYILNTTTGHERLFDVTRDPAERNNLVSDPASEPILAEMRRSLERSLTRAKGLAADSRR